MEKIHYQHEEYGGGGYPVGLKGQSITLGSRILSVACAVDAMLSERPHRQPKNKDEIGKELVEKSGLQLDLRVVMALFEVLKKDGGLLGGWQLDDDWMRRLKEKFGSK